MIESLTGALERSSSGVAGLALALAIGVLSAAVSACCTLPALGALIAYSGAQDVAGRRRVVAKALFFVLGTFAALMLVGGVVGFAGKAVQAGFGKYWKILTGVLLVAMGLWVLKIPPFDRALRNRGGVGLPDKVSGGAGVAHGFVLGGLFAAASMCCNPGMFVVVGLAMVHGSVVGGIALLGMFALGFSLPFGAIALGVSLGRAFFLPKGAGGAVKWVAGGVLVAAGFVLLLAA